jgi:hypothetical protein
MSSHTDEETYTWAQIEDAYDEAHKTNVMRGKAALKTRLNRSAIHSGVPVMYIDDLGDRGIEWAENMSQSRYKSATNLHVLIPKETAREMLVRSISGLGFQSDRQRAIENFDQDIADYRRNGPGDSHD